MYKDAFVEALDAYRAASDGDEGEWERYWAELDRAAVGGNRSFVIAAQFAQSDDFDRHHVAIDLMGRIAEKHPHTAESVATAVLESVTGESEGPLVASAANALGSTRSPAGVPFLLGCLDSDVTPVRVSAVIALASCADQSRAAMAAVVSATRDDDAEIRRYATFGLAANVATDNNVIRDALAERLTDNEEMVRNESIRGLAFRHDERAVPLIKRALKSENPSTEILRAADYLGMLNFRG